MFADELRFARADLDWDAIYRVRCPACRAPSLKLREDAAVVTCSACEKEFGDGSIVLPSSRTGHCHLCHAVAACVLTDGIKRCLPCHVAWDAAGQPEQPGVKPLWTVRFWFPFSKLRVPSPTSVANAFDQYQSGLSARPQGPPRP